MMQKYDHYTERTKQMQHSEVATVYELRSKMMLPLSPLNMK